MRSNNSKLREKAKKEEGKRIRAFVEAAYKYDPRITAFKDAERADRHAALADMCNLCLALGSWARG